MELQTLVLWVRTLLEEGRNLYEVLNLKICSLQNVRRRSERGWRGRMDSLTITRVATKYPEVAKEYFRHKRRESIEISKTQRFC